ncbi:hypothetical protein [Cryptosporangium arvum]|uniref:Uncharacterized protein n=1 Tax=Cryptosporangium arvum DSM 44712 TaxID=927661 RepID=A0A010Z633_9ACTN|nr:hypothetical protein [Cryptosporangium arvum]EXG82748.1 hypothetical protein CryarDRAFT_3949 [Cryptosporangium arvum DSM 44712]
MTRSRQLAIPRQRSGPAKRTAAVAPAYTHVVPPRPFVPSVSDTRCRSMVSKSSYYFSTYWWRTKNRYAATGIPNITWTDAYATGMEVKVREACNAALTMAVCAGWGGHLPSAISLDLGDVRNRAARLVVGVARRHVTYGTGGARWGGNWQSAYWAYSLGLAAWLLWRTQLTNAWDREAVCAVVEYEADQQLHRNRPEIWRDSTGVDQPFSGVYRVGIRSGDSAAEENMWQATVLDLAATMMPGHPRAAAWRAKAAQFGIVGAMSRNDLWDTGTDVNGESPNHWTVGTTMASPPPGPAQIGKPGYNWSEQYVVTNHGKRNPDYMQADAMRLALSLHHSLAGEPTPEWVRWNSARIYGAMRTVVYPGTVSPAKPMYKDTASPSLYFPDGSDWGTARHTGFWLWDSLVETHVGPSPFVPVGAVHWGSVHGAAAKAMQDRTGVMPGGQVVRTDLEDKYPGREGWHASSAAFVVLNKALTNAGRLSWTNAPLV